jgi:hypothetical protein
MSPATGRGGSGHLPVLRVPRDHGGRPRIEGGSGAKLLLKLGDQIVLLLERRGVYLVLPGEFGRVFGALYFESLFELLDDASHRLDRVFVDHDRSSGLRHRSGRTSGRRPGLGYCGVRSGAAGRCVGDVVATCSLLLRVFVGPFLEVLVAHDERHEPRFVDLAGRDSPPPELQLGVLLLAVAKSDCQFERPQVVADSPGALPRETQFVEGVGDVDGRVLVRFPELRVSHCTLDGFVAGVHILEYSFGRIRTRCHVQHRGEVGLPVELQADGLDGLHPTSEPNAGGARSRAVHVADDQLGLLHQSEDFGDAGVVRLLVRNAVVPPDLGWNAFAALADDTLRATQHSQNQVAHGGLLALPVDGGVGCRSGHKSAPSEQVFEPDILYHLYIKM